MKHTPLLLVLPLLGTLASCAMPHRPLAGLPPTPRLPPAPPVLFVSSPAHALLNNQSGITYAHDLADALAAYGIPTTTTPPKDQNWQLKITARHADGQIAPFYQIIGPDHKTYGQISGTQMSELDWKTSDPAKLAQIVKRDSAALSGVLTKLNNHIQQTNPDSLANRTPLLFIDGVVGAAGDGDASLTSNLAHAFLGSKLKLTPSLKGADFSVSGDVKALPVAAGDNVTQINWIVRDSNGRLVGQVTQLRELKPSQMTPHWGALALNLTQEAANGISTVIFNDIVKKQKPEAPVTHAP